MRSKAIADYGKSVHTLAKQRPWNFYQEITAGFVENLKVSQTLRRIVTDQTVDQTHWSRYSLGFRMLVISPTDVTAGWMFFLHYLGKIPHRHSEIMCWGGSEIVLFGSIVISRPNSLQKVLSFSSWFTTPNLIARDAHLSVVIHCSACAARHRRVFAGPLWSVRNRLPANRWRR